MPLLEPQHLCAGTYPHSEASPVPEECRILKGTCLNTIVLNAGVYFMPPKGLLNIQKVCPLPGDSDSDILKPTLKIDFLKTNLPDDWDRSPNLRVVVLGFGNLYIESF